eukprot:710218-Hanusia_phi.AAC.1
MGQMSRHPCNSSRALGKTLRTYSAMQTLKGRGGGVHDTASQPVELSCSKTRHSVHDEDILDLDGARGADSKFIDPVLAGAT